jgi:hypothetical protein
MWYLGPDRLGYEKVTTVVRSLHDRFHLACSYRFDELRRLLKHQSVSYRVETAQDILQFVAFLNKPLAELLDELQVPRERIEREFIEFHGPVIPDPNRPRIRHIVPGLVSQPKSFAVQPLAEPSKLLHSLRLLYEIPKMLDISTIVNQK